MTPLVPTTGRGRLTYHPTWPRLRSAIAPDPAVEARVARLVTRMTLEEKLGQMIQPELAQLTPQDVTDYKIGSALNGAGIWPGGDRHAGVAAWVETVDTFWAAAEEAYRDRPFRIPFMWATDAVHGHNNVYGATVFPHNIGLGAAGDPDLVRRIGRASAREILATGMDWTFAPTVTTPRDRRWGRYYEGYSEDPELVHAYAAAMVEGLQGGAEALRTGRGVIATVKHWVADGGTADGADRGTARCPEDHVRNIHAAGFYSAIEAGAQCVMASFSSWENPANYDHSPGRGEPYNHKVHGSRYLITDVLKDAIGFDGIVISDWDAHSEVANCAPGDAGYAINAGLDVLMIAGRAAWQSVYHTAIEQVRSGIIPMSRIDDAVARVLRVKLRAGLWTRPRPTERPVGTVGGHHELSREAARRSVVLLKNTAGVLPIRRSARVLATGSGVNDISKQTGGWTLTWQGDDIVPADLPGGATVAEALAEAAADVVVDPELIRVDPTVYDVAVVVLGEDSYAEMRGTLKPWRSLGYADLKLSYARDLEILRKLRHAGVPIVTVFLTGRPLYVTEEINLSDAFAVAWLPGPHGGGIADVLFGAHDFTGRLPSSWPRGRFTSAVNRIPPHIPDYAVPPEETEPEGDDAPLFEVGYGLTLADLGPGPLPLDPPRVAPPAAAEAVPLPILTGGRPATGLRFRIGGHNTWSRVDIDFAAPTDELIVRADPLGGELRLRFKGFPAFVYAENTSGLPRDLRGYAAAGGAISLGIRVVERPERPLYLAVHDDYPAQPGLDITDRLGEEWTTLRVPLAELRRIGSDLEHVDVPFMIYTEGSGCVELRNIRWTP
ncbi:glycoside hydrolase family 3 protein [Actinokineospora fastidiosa]|uniref:1,4-beta-D-glucan glucohydrolase n=1 Tax=Actinokineospora fastidiosa TaxID=1816 RepID=A0A918G6C1_9PSEU|nr:glycoside hydrolase family 3 protein [Actinokineospora fastidiosa]GGS20692.1 1,4-beta-D-glucan glucohydrolase [Actinokineospora fastidiosa]